MNLSIFICTIRLVLLPECALLRTLDVHVKWTFFTWLILKGCDILGRHLGNLTVQKNSWWTRFFNCAEDCYFKYLQTLLHELNSYNCVQQAFFSDLWLGYNMCTQHIDNFCVMHSSSFPPHYLISVKEWQINVFETCVGARFQATTTTRMLSRMSFTLCS